MRSKRQRPPQGPLVLLWVLLGLMISRGAAQLRPGGYRQPLEGEIEPEGVVSSIMHRVLVGESTVQPLYLGTALSVSQQPRRRKLHLGWWWEHRAFRVLCRL
jgi:hypothetical protein